MEKLCERKRSNNLERGFTLLEIMVVLIIISLIVGIIGPRIYKKLKQGRIITAKAQIQNLEAALMDFNADMGRFPTTEEGLKALIQNPGSDMWSGPYLSKKRVPKDPWGRDYVYMCPGNHDTPYDLFSKGPDGQEGTDDDICNWK